MQRSLKKDGIYLNILSPSGLKIKLEDLLFLKELMEKEKLRVVIDRISKLDQIVEAHQYVDKGHKKGNVFISIQENYHQA